MQFNQELCTLLSEQIPAFYIKLLNFCERFDNCDNMSNEASGGLADLVDHACIMDETLSYGMQTPEEKRRSEEERQSKINSVMAANKRPPKKEVQDSSTCFYANDDYALSTAPCQNCPDNESCEGCNEFEIWQSLKYQESVYDESIQPPKNNWNIDF